MTILIVAYELRKTGQNYDKLYEAIKQFTWAHPMGSFWFIKTNLSCNDVFDQLKPYIDINDSLFVGSLGLYKTCLSQEIIDWLNR